MNNRFFGQSFNTPAKQAYIFLHIGQGYFALSVNFGEVGAFLNIKTVDFYAVGGFAYVPRRVEYHFLGFAGQPNYHVGYYGYANGVKATYGVVIYVKRVSAANKLGGLFVYRLKPKLNPNGLYLV